MKLETKASNNACAKYTQINLYGAKICLLACISCFIRKDNFMVSPRPYPYLS
jgi:hypothetical protein